MNSASLSKHSFQFLEGAGSALEGTSTSLPKDDPCYQFLAGPRRTGQTELQGQISNGGPRMEAG